MSSIVVGAGVTGLAAAGRFAAAGEPVVVLEATSRPGGAIRTETFAGRRVDVGAESLYDRDPALPGLLEHLGLTGDVVRAERRPVWIATRRGLRPLPQGVGPAGPTRVAPLVRSGILGPLALARAAAEPVIPRSRIDGDPSIGAVMRARLGAGVTEALVEPLAGGLHAGDIDQLSLDAVLPSVATSLREHGSLLRASAARRRSTAGSNAPAESPFITLRGGMARLVTALAAGLDVRLDHPVAGLAHDGARWQVSLTDGRRLAADRIVLAVPGAVVRRLLAGLLPDVDTVPAETASVAVVLLALPSSVRSHPALAGTGMLVPRRLHRTVKAATFVSSKWSHLDDGPVLVRASVGRAGEPPTTDDAELVARVLADLDHHAGLVAAPVATRVVRWTDAMPQYVVGHGRRRATLADALQQLPAVTVAGASFDGVGIPACLRAGAAAADRVLAGSTQEIVP